MKILVTGGTGFLGAYLIRYLVAQGKEVIALKRATSKMDLVAPVKDKVEWIEGDILDVSILNDVVPMVERIYHCAAIVSFDPRDRELMYQTNIEGTANIVNMALQYDIKKLVFVSSIAALGREKDKITVDESAKWEVSDLNSHYAITKYHSEQEVWRGAAEGLNIAIVNPSMIMGAGFWNSGTAGFFKKQKKGLKFYPIGTTGYVDVRDVVKIMIQLMDSDISGERFVLNSENLNFKTFLTAVAHSVDGKPPHIAVTKLIRETAWRVDYLRSLLTNGRPLVTKETARSSAHTFHYQNGKVKKALNYEFIPIQQTIEETGKLYLATHQDGFGLMDLV